MFNDMKVEMALRNAVEKHQNFYQFRGSIDLLTKKYFLDEIKREEFLGELAEFIKEHDYPH